MGWAIQRVLMAENFGWSFEYIDQLSFEQVQTIMGVWAGREAAKDSA